MFVAVIRGDLSKPLFIADLEPKSQANATTESPLGQNRYITRPDATRLAAYLTSESLTVVVANLIAATVPVGGPVDISPATIRGVTGLAAATDAQVTAIQNFLAAKFVETEVVKGSYLNGNLAGFRSASFNPDSRRVPAISNGAAIALVQDDGVTPFTVAVPTIVTADKDTPVAGALRISGSGFTDTGLYELSVILVGTGANRLTKAAILAGGGTITSSQINIPAALVPAIAVGYTSARVRVNDLLSNSVALT